ncbi:MAG: hypothetical protein A3F31_02400 [Candidatus Levybacteria bacterium RIFCSPHIGHO2_12_FULL_38_12]|nr:MAG: hypothetical protein A3F31_02400 [Candidatus Levybacteria bacterium RIFCSPHIGHO2_12_FULL_38_12]
MNRKQAYELLIKYLYNKNLLKHSLAAEASMKAIYKHLHGEDLNEIEQEKWGIAGLLHDIDYQLAQETNQLDKHGLLIFEKEPGVIPEDIAHAIRTHNFENTKETPVTDIAWAIACADQLTGFIVAAALVHPDKKLEPLTSEFIKNRMKEKSFAKGANRESILLCEEKLGIPLNTFIELILSSMKSISNQLEL